MEAEGPVTLISVTLISACAQLQSPGPRAGLRVGGAEPGLGAALVFRVPGEVGLVAAEELGGGFSLCHWQGQEAAGTVLGTGAPMRVHAVLHASP